MDRIEAKPLPTDLSFKALFAANTTYNYFSGASDAPFCHEASTYEAVNAWWLAECSMLAYVRDEGFVRQKLSAAGLAHTFFFDHDCTQAFISHNDRFAIVCFRGTEIEEIEDVLTDLNLRFSSNSGRGQVHTGFKRSLDLVWDNPDSPSMLSCLQQLKADNPHLKIWFTGHSLGAALATLAADRFALSQNTPCQGLYTFGSPRVADADFFKLFNTPCYRFVNNNDIVCMVPPAMGYRHVGQLKYIDEVGVIHDNPGRWEKMKSRLLGHIDHLGEIFRNWREGKFNVVPVDYLNDHAPVYYVVHTWNNLRS